MPTVVITGHAGFVGSHLIREILRTTDWVIIGIDNFSLGATVSDTRLREFVPFFNTRFFSLRCDFSRFDELEKLEQLEQLRDGVDYVIHNGAYSHVTESLKDARRSPIMSSNVQGTLNMLEFAFKRLKPRKFLYTSTDEVFGASLVPHKECDTLCPSNPYSASKAAGEMLVKAYQKCFGVPCIITRTTNMYGTQQQLEKFIPTVIHKIWEKELIEVHTDSNGVVGSRQWIHASEQARAILFLLQGDYTNETFHIAGEQKTNLEIVHAIYQALKARGFDFPPRIKLLDAFEQFPGHDLHYSLDDSKIRAAGWTPRLTFEQGLALTV